MRKNNLKKTLAGTLASLICALSVPAVPTAVYSTAYAAQTFTVSGNQQQFKNDNVDGYSYEIWLDRTGGSGSMTLVVKDARTRNPMPMFFSFQLPFPPPISAKAARMQPRRR